MRLIHFHVNERDVTDKAHVSSLQIPTEYAVVESRHEEQRCHARLEHSHEADERAQEAVEEEVEMVEYEVELSVLESSHRSTGEKVSAQVPNEESLEQEDCENGQYDLGDVLCDHVECDKESDQDDDDGSDLEQDQVSPKHVSDRVATLF